jgi:hypothetical protein
MFSAIILIIFSTTWLALPLRCVAHASSHDVEREIGSSVKGTLQARGNSGAPYGNNSDEASCVSTTLFNATSLDMLSCECANALAEPIECQDTIWHSNSLYGRENLSLDDLKELCTPKCEASIAKFRENADKACCNELYTDPVANSTSFVYGTGFPDSIYNIKSVSVRPIALADYFFTNYKLLCMQDE